MLLSKRAEEEGRKERIIALLRKTLKNSPIGQHLCDKYDEDESFIDTIPVDFAPLDVSAKTVNGRILLNSGLLEGDFRDCFRYILHEAVHALQQENGDVGNGQNGDYLDDPYEVEAFWYQLESMDDMYSPEEVQEYIEGLLDHHGLKGKKREEKRKELTDEKEPEKPADEIDKRR